MKKLSDIAQIRAGFPFRGKIPEGVQHFVVQMKNISLDGEIAWHDCDKTNIEKSHTDWLEDGDILLSAKGERNYAVLVKNVEKQKAVASPHLFVIRVKHHNVLPAFLVWLLNQRFIQKYFEQNAEGSGMKNIRRPILENTPIIIPSRQKQQTIVSLAHNLKQQRMLLEKLIATEEKVMTGVAQSIMTEQEKAK
ncbi:Type I restriction modification DNA specificity domain-containing protein [Pasteurella multocida]|uniref:restriction endonuclease subunit S n=1 Tax=Pasteurella multocida TaxID=747 RepID=UPI0008F1140A|nr:restriction endonuclease subunit S [Pasteurella multocida]SFP27307.1 Type I restriction modification DNA specificity domain-containing protein [Pasteurella multocida]VEE36938.1 EcoKI restriction-modification system protein HsdS [Pasteurella multocida subsp. gallicida]